ncbi:hypothetical protein D3Z58_18090 [Clostridiaceae bacterium]|nr:hypothetical protein [Clostridiaceae bacterium]
MRFSFSAEQQERPRATYEEPGGGCAVTSSTEERANNTSAANGTGQPRATIRRRTGWPPVPPGRPLACVGAPPRIKLSLDGSRK